MGQPDLSIPHTEQGAIRLKLIMLSTPGIHSQLTIRRATQKEVIQAFIQGRKSRLDVIVDMNDEKDDSNFIAEDFLACFMAAAQAAARWSSLNLISPPPHGEYHSLQILQPLGRLKTVKVACGLGGFFEQLMTAISRSVSPNFTTMILADESRCSTPPEHLPPATLSSHRHKPPRDD